MKLPAMTKVTSSNIDAMGHSKDGLFVQFKSGGVYRYPDAPKSVYDGGVKAESPGSFFRSQIMGKFRHVKHDA